MINWAKGYTATYSLMTVNGSTWADATEVDLASGSIDRGTTSDLRESATLTTTEVVPADAWVRVYLQATQGGDSERVALFTGIVSIPSRAIDGTRETYELEAYSVLKPASDILVPLGYYAPAGSGAGLVKELISVSPAPISVKGVSPVTTDSIVAEKGETNLTMALSILDAIGWRLRISGDGTVTICAEPTEASESFGATENDCVENMVTDKADWFSVPNCFRASTDEDGAAVARDDDPASSLSTISRGREIWAEETRVTLASGETVASYAVKRLKEEQALTRSVKYTRRYFPTVTAGDMISLAYPRQGLEGRFKVKSQSIELGHGCPTDEEVESI